MATIRKRTGSQGVSYQAIVRKKANGKFHNLSKTFSKKKLAQLWAQQKEYEIERGEYSDITVIKGITVKDCIERYIQEVDPIKPISRSKRAVLARLQRSSIATEQIAQLEGSNIVAFCVERRLEDGAEPSTIVQDVIYLGAVIKMAISVWGFPLKNNAVDMAKPFLKQKRLIGKSKCRERRPTPDELETVKECISSNKRILLPMCDIIDFAVASAFRLGEICRIQWDDLDIETGTVVIRDRKDPNEKQGNDQTVPLSEQAMEIIASQPRVDSRIFPVDARSVSTNFTRQCKKAGVKDLHFHDLRHEGTSRLFEQGLDIQHVAMITGHKDWGMLRRYTHLKPGDVAKALRE